MGNLLVKNAVSRIDLQTSLNPTGAVSVQPCRTNGSPFLIDRADGGLSIEFPIDRLELDLFRSSSV